MNTDKIDFFERAPSVWEIPKTGVMRVPGRFFMNKTLIKDTLQKDALKQVVNVASLPGIIKASLAMPDIHLGYGFPIGGVAAFCWNDGIISPGGVGYDINCGVRLASTNLKEKDISARLSQLADALCASVPAGIGSKGVLKLSLEDEKKILKYGSQWAVSNGLGSGDDIEHTEDKGFMPEADPSMISETALIRGKQQLGSLGGGNHFLEIGVVKEIFDTRIAKIMDIRKDHITVLIHSGSRGLGYQVCDDYIFLMMKNVKNIYLPDSQLAYTRIQSVLGQSYYKAMACAANYAWANRQVLLHIAKTTLKKVFDITSQSLGMNQVYDVCHNIAKREDHIIDGKKRTICVHRKGATRAFPPGHAFICDKYKAIGQPVLVPGSMGTSSYIMVGTKTAMKETFGSTCHGAGRVLSRKMAKRKSKGRSIRRELEDVGIFVRTSGKDTIKEEMPEAYKNIDQIVKTAHDTGLSTKVARLSPMCVIKG